ncbi:MAG: hypothetical protein ACOYOH_11090 [Paracraurococcus sp.]
MSPAVAGLPLDGEVRPLGAAVEIATSLWGPFHRICLEVQANGHAHIIRSGPLSVTPLERGELQIATTLHVPTASGAIRATLTLRRAVTGELLETGLSLPPDTGAGTAATLAALRSGLANQACGFLGRQSLGDGDVVVLGTAGATPLLCRVLGRARHRGRPVLVARCVGTQPVAEAGCAGLLVAEGHVAVDIATGMVILGALGCRIAGAAPDTGDIRLRAWVTLRQDKPASA